MILRFHRIRAPLIATLPGLVLVVVAITGSAPMLGDLDAYFHPLRQRTAEVITGEMDPFWNPDSGCGEPFYSNPQTVLLYPPAWFSTIVPVHQAIGFEAGFHLALLGAGCTLLARRLGAGEIAGVAAGIGVALSGPIADSIGVLNNLETLAWIPWLWWSVLGDSQDGFRITKRSTFTISLFFAGAVLGAEPQLALIAALIALLIAPTWRTIAGLGLGTGLVAVQIVPFCMWIDGGDRGPQLIGGALTGTLELRELLGFVFSDYELPQRFDRFLNHLHVPLWSGFVIIIAAIKGTRTVKKLVWCSMGFALLAFVSSVPVGREFWGILTQGMVRFPARLIFLALVAGLPAAAASIEELCVPRWLSIVFGLFLLTGCAFLPFCDGVALFGLGAAFWVLSGPKPAIAALFGSLVLIGVQFDALKLGEDRKNLPVLCADAQQGERLYTLEPSWAQFRWVYSDRTIDRERALGFGYQSLEDGRSTVRTFAPLKAAVLAAHLKEADRGPEGRWWLDTLAAGRIVAHHEVVGFKEVCREGGLFVYDNAKAWPRVSLQKTMPIPDVQSSVHGRIVEVAIGDQREWIIEVGKGGGVFVIAESPDPGWSYRLDGRPTEMIQGPGILQCLPVPEGQHRVSASMIPTGFVTGALITLFSLAIFVFGFVRFSS